MSNTGSGYDFGIFLEKPGERYLCGICLNVLNEPRQCQNGHCFCLECFNLALSTRKACPVCKIKTLPNTLGRNLFVQESINDMKTICKSCERSSTTILTLNEYPDRCNWIGKLENRQNHYDEECQFKLLKCTNKNCPKTFQRRSLEAHDKVCGFKLIECSNRNCNVKVERKSVEIHASVCEYSKANRKTVKAPEWDFVLGFIATVITTFMLSWIWRETAIGKLVLKLMMNLAIFIGTYTFKLLYTILYLMLRIIWSFIIKYNLFFGTVTVSVIALRVYKICHVK